MEATEVHDDTEANRYVITVDGAVAGFARYVRRGGRTIFVHTEIDDQFEGRGLGSSLAAGALDAERAAGTPIVQLRRLGRRYIDRHPGYADTVDHELLDRIDGA